MCTLAYKCRSHEYELKNVLSVGKNVHLGPEAESR